MLTDAEIARNAALLGISHAEFVRLRSLKNEVAPPAMETLPEDGRWFKPENLMAAITKPTIGFITWPIRIVTKLWSGKYPLNLAFWWFYIFGIFPYLFFMFIFLILPLELLGIHHAARMFLPIGMLYIPLASVGAWRSATVYEGDVRWSIAAKIIIVCGGARYAYFLANGGFDHILSLAT